MRKEMRPEGDGWRTLREIGKMLKFRESYLRRWVHGEVASGRLEKFLGTQLIEGKLYRQVWYHPKRAKGAPTH